MAIRKRRLDVFTPMIVAGALCSLTSIADSAQTTADRYIEARDHAIEESKSPYEALTKRCKEIEKAQGMGAADSCWKIQGAGLFERDRENLTSLERLLRQAIGPFSLEGFDTGKINLETLTPEADLGRLDGLKYTSKDAQTTLLVTTRPLVNDWLGKFYDRPTVAVRDLTGVLSMEPGPFMTQAWAIQDQHFDLVDHLPVTKPDHATLVAAFLGELCAEDENYVPDSVLAEVVFGDRVYLISQPVSIRLPTLDDCDRQWQKLWDLRKPDDAATAFNQCYSSRVTASPAYRAAVEQAQRLVNSFSR